MAPSPTIRRLLRETAELSSSAPNPSPAFHAAPVSDSDLHEWHFTLLGPPAPSPYEGGLYHGRITLPSTYPLKPPNFRFLTPSGRFEINREICLSISGFHEETWMPAWGVRTALTALRTFMAEAGTAGQVGGLEAPAEVRRRLARESREWRCGMGCGSKKNIEVMKEWWGVCREKGVQVDEEGSGQGTEMEVLPEGLNLEARSKDERPQLQQEQQKQQQQQKSSEISSQSNPHPQPTEQTTSQPSQHPQHQQQQPQSSPQAPPPTSSSSTLLRPTSSSSSKNPTSNSTSPIPHTATPTPESAQAHAESYLSTSDLASATSNSTTPRHRRPMISVHAPPLAAASAALNNRRALQSSSSSSSAGRDGHTRTTAPPRTTPPQPPTLTIDRAIAGVFVMLILMLLKKIFYPAGGLGELGGVMGVVGLGAGGGVGGRAGEAGQVRGAGEVGWGLGRGWGRGREEEEGGGGAGGFYMERDM